MPSKRILIVDDDEVALTLLRKRLKEENLEVIEARTGAEAIAATNSFFPNVIIMDILLPDLDGPEAVLQIRKSPITKNIPVIFLSSIALKENEEDLNLSGPQKNRIKVGKDSFPALSKPIQFEVLLKYVYEALNA